MSQQWQGPPGQQGYGPPQNAPQPYYGAPGGVPPKSSNTLVIVLIVVGLVIVFIGILAALAISGVHRYLTSAKAAEAKNSVSAIARGVVASYEHERPSMDATSSTHQLCGAAVPVPDSVPRGTKYQPSPATGKDYQTGDATHGWICLRFDAHYPSYYQYEYRVGGDYKGPSRGGPDPGPDGFEVSAEGDLNGDGVTSLFTLTGKVDKTTHTIHLDDSMFISKEFE
jgi:hypothetical protein